MSLIPWEGPWACPNCGATRFVHNGIVEQCGVCGDEEIDIALAEMQSADDPLLRADTVWEGQKE